MNDYPDDVAANTEISPYFAPLLPWQAALWRTVCQNYHMQKLPHALLAGGISGIGKHSFVWRLTAWLLCQNKPLDEYKGACGYCPSCLWLKAGTHPDLLVLPPSSRIGEAFEETQIKIDDVRFLQEYGQTKGHGLRLIVLDNAENLTTAGANALLKTLEEPRFGVHLILISSYPSRLLPTIKSRLQTLPLTPIHHLDAKDYLKQNLPSDICHLSDMLLTLAEGAPLGALSLPNMPWFDKRTLWVKTFVALQKKTRAPIAASSYWQTVLSFDDFMTLTRLMLLEVLRIYLGFTGIHQDIDIKTLLQDTPPPSLENLYQLNDELNQMTQAIWQNVQPKLAYDELMVRLANL